MLYWIGMTKNLLNVVCGLIESNGKILLGKRSPPRRHAGFWEFPGGKINPGESPINALSREIMEELGVIVHVGKQLSEVYHEYETHSVRLYPFICRITEGTVAILEYREIAWIDPANTMDLPLLPPDFEILKEYIQTAKNR
jgi:8-oxo-dGTP diphosphatase